MKDKTDCNDKAYAKTEGPVQHQLLRRLDKPKLRCYHICNTMICLKPQKSKKEVRKWARSRKRKKYNGSNGLVWDFIY